jgi:tetratricopeptide (TPR) repeat protein
MNRTLETKHEGTSSPAAGANCDARRHFSDARVDGLLHRSVEHLKTGRIADALSCVRLLNPAKERRPARSNLAGLVCLSAGDNEAALAWFDRAVLLDPAAAQGWSNRAAALHELGRDGALAAYDEAVRLGLAEPELFYNRGNLLRAAGRLDEAIASYDAALALNPAYPEALRASALVLRDLGHREGALEFLDEATRLRPDFVEALVDRGDLLQSLDREEEAIAAYDRALGRAPDHAAALNNRAAALLTLARYREAGEAFDAALRAHPNSPQSWNNRGNLMLATQNPEAALASYERALALRTDYLEALIGRSGAKKQLGRFDESLTDLDAALALDPQSDHARNNKAVLLLQRGDYEEGWDLYESRWINSRTPKHALTLPIPQWNGQALDGKRIVVFDEQGFGDAIQFVRFCFALLDRGATVAFFCRKPLHRLFGGLTRTLRVVDDFAPGERFDYQSALCSLPRALRTRSGTIPAQKLYLRAEPGLVAKWAARLGSRGFKVGVCWRGSANPKADPGRAVPVAAFAALVMEGVRLVSLQKPADSPGADRADSPGADRAESPGADRADPPWLERLGPDFDAGPDGFVDTAALMASLDLVVTCDTSIAHLAGALGRPVLTLLQRVPDWRWGLDGDLCPWYPSMRLIRQSRSGDWSEPMSRVRESLERLSRASPPPSYS